MKEYNQTGWVGGCSLGVVNRYIKAFMHSLADNKGEKTGWATLQNTVHAGGNTDVWPVECSGVCVCNRPGLPGGLLESTEVHHGPAHHVLLWLGRGHTLKALAATGRLPACVSKSVVDTIGLGDKQFSQSSLNHGKYHKSTK